MDAAAPVAQHNQSNKMENTGKLFMVVWDDEQGLCLPQVWDSDCDGALCGLCCGQAAGVAIFDSRKQARAAIAVSTKWNALLKAQGRTYNVDFENGVRQNLRIVECSRTYKTNRKNRV